MGETGAPPPKSNGTDAPSDKPPAANGAATDALLAYDTLDDLFSKHLPPAEHSAVRRLLYGVNGNDSVAALELPASTASAAAEQGFDLQGYTFAARTEQLRPPRVVRVGLIQHAAPLSPSAPYAEQRAAAHTRVAALVEAAGAAGVNVLCLQEAWPMPFAFCTREREWSEFAEDVETGPSTGLLAPLAAKHRMVIISPILERDSAHGDTIWNTAVVINHCGAVIGKHRKNHIPRIPPFDESHYYAEGNTGHPVFHTVYGRIAINICYGRHQPLNWLGFALNGAELVFNPSATIAGLSEPMWGVEARNAAIANSYYVAAINRVGTEVYPTPFTTGAPGKPPQREMGPFYGSSYVAAPDASRTPSLSRSRDGLLVADCNLNLCRQVRDRWCFQMTARYDMYAKLLGDYVKPDYKHQIVRDPALSDAASGTGGSA